MISLAVHGIDQTLGGRLRRAFLTTEEQAVAVAFLGQAAPEPATVGRLLAAGKHVLLAGNPVRAHLSLVSRSGARLVVLNPDRFLRSRRLIRDQIGGNLGEVGLIRIHRWQPRDAAAVALACDLDLALWLTDRQPEIVFAVRAGPSVQVHLGFPGGGMALIDHCTGLPPGDGYGSLSVIGFSGAAYADDHHDVQLVYRGGRAQAVRTEEGLVQAAAIVQDFVDGLHDGRDWQESIDAWRQVFRVEDAVQESLTTGQAVRVEGR